MADETKDRNLNRDDALGAAAGQQREVPSGDSRDQRDENAQFEQDDVAEDRNLSGSTTWLTLPDQQPKGEPESDSGERKR